MFCSTACSLAISRVIRSWPAVSWSAPGQSCRESSLQVALLEWLPKKRNILKHLRKTGGSVASREHEGNASLCERFCDKVSLKAVEIYIQDRGIECQR